MKQKSRQRLMTQDSTSQDSTVGRGLSRKTLHQRPITQDSASEAYHGERERERERRGYLGP
jgi:hypothetical protein